MAATIQTMPVICVAPMCSPSKPAANITADTGHQHGQRQWRNGPVQTLVEQKKGHHCGDHRHHAGNNTRICAGGKLHAED